MFGDEMDYLLVSSTGIDFTTNVSKNAFIDISDYIDTYLPGAKAQLPEAAWEAYFYNDGIYGICSIKDLSNQMGCFPTQSTRMSILVLGILPIMVAYPFFQKYFVHGLTIGSVNG